MSNQSRHPEGTSVGGQWAPGAADEIDDGLLSDSEPGFADWAEYDDEGLLRHPSPDALASAVLDSAEQHPDAVADLRDGTTQAQTFADACDRHRLDGSAATGYGDSYRQIRSLHPHVDEIEFADRFGRIDFSSARMLHHAEAGDAEEMDDIDDDVAGAQADHESAAAEYGRILSREVALLAEADSRAAQA